MSALQKIDEQTSPRDLRARKILAAARANLAGHVERNERVARALATARANIVRLDPKRLASIRALEPTREQELAARLRQERVARTLRDARDTVARLANMQAPSRPAKTVYKTRLASTGSAIATGARAGRARGCTAGRADRLLRCLPRGDSRIHPRKARSRARALAARNGRFAARGRWRCPRA